MGHGSRKLTNFHLCSSGCAQKPSQYLKSDVIGIDKVVLCADYARLRVAKLTNIRVEDLNVETADEIVAGALLELVRLRLTQRTND